MAQTQAATEPKPRLSAYQLNELRSEWSSLQDKLASAREAEQETRARLLEVMNQESKAHRFLSATEGVAGYSNERTRATQMLEHCSEVRPQLERGAEARGRQIKEFEAALGKIDRASLAQKGEIEELAKEFQVDKDFR